METVRRALAQSLECGRFSGASARALERAWHRWSAPRVARPLQVPDGVVTIAVGGPTLGGSGKTPLALACARFIAEQQSARVALIGHAYRATPRIARVVHPSDDVRVVGDEALMCVHAVSAPSPPEVRGLPRPTFNAEGGPGRGSLDVIVAPTRQLAIDLALARGARILVLDGVLQMAPRRATLSLLACDALAPWGSDACPPCGDLRAPKDALLAACDHVVTLSDDLVRSRGAFTSTGAMLPYEQLARMNLGLVTSVARPARIRERLRTRGVVPRAVFHASDHGVPSPRELASLAATHCVEGWLATHKCSIHLRNSSVLPLYVMEHDVHLDTTLRCVLRDAIGPEKTREM
ncbi:tetraacyldisaccharide 4'-kinase [Pendulispora rubella]|uniref:Tetraacyldisaccharide 4'-kinase n=1 Tax=Pendulispora rubella TaxID=2741070 RepID=A0ABZ2KXI9_9BACT